MEVLTRLDVGPIDREGEEGAADRALFLVPAPPGVGGNDKPDLTEGGRGSDPTLDEVGVPAHLVDRPLVGTFLAPTEDLLRPEPGLWGRDKVDPSCGREAGEADPGRDNPD